MSFARTAFPSRTAAIMPEKLDNETSPERGLFWRALRAPEWELASKEFIGAFHEKAPPTGAYLGLLLFVPWIAAPSVLGPAVLIPVREMLDPPRDSVLEFVFILVGAFLVYMALSAAYALILFVFSGDRYTRTPLRNDRDALTGRTAKRLAIVHFARFLRRLVFPWEWYSGRP